MTEPERCATTGGPTKCHYRFSRWEILFERGRKICGVMDYSGDRHFLLFGHEFVSGDE